MDWRAKVELFEEIRREYEFGIGTIAGVAKKLKVHRRMVREAIGSAVPETEQPIFFYFKAPVAGAPGKYRDVVPFALPHGHTAIPEPVKDFPVGAGHETIDFLLALGTRIVAMRS